MASSISKRKRDEMDVDGPQSGTVNTDACRSLLVHPVFSSANSSRSANQHQRRGHDWFSLFTSGHILCVSPSINTITIYPSMLKRSEESEKEREDVSIEGIVINLHNDIDCSKWSSCSDVLVDMGNGPNNSLDLAMCSSAGLLLLVNVPIGQYGAISSDEVRDQQSVQQHVVKLSEEDEAITSVCHAGVNVSQT